MPDRKDFKKVVDQLKQSAKHNVNDALEKAKENFEKIKQAHKSDNDAIKKLNDLD